MVGSRTTAGSIKNWINRNTTDPDTVLTDAQALIYTTLRHWKMKAEATGTMTASSSTGVALPSDYLDGRQLRITGLYAARLKKGDESSVQDHYQYDGSGVRIAEQPRWWYVSGTAAKFDSLPDQAYPYLLNYYSRPAALDTNTTTNFLTTDLPRLLRTACMLIACEFEKEVGQGQYDRTYWQQQFDKQLLDAQAVSNIADMDRDSPPDLG